jgi:hypothetical protein
MLYKILVVLGIGGFIGILKWFEVRSYKKRIKKYKSKSK